MAEDDKAQEKVSDSTKAKKQRISQEDVPGYPLADALKVSEAIIENFAGSETPPLRVAKAMGLQPNSSHFRQLCGASIAYGLTVGGYNAATIKPEQLAKRIFKPLDEGDDLVAQKEAFLKPKIIGQFLTKYNNSPLPRGDIAENVLSDMGVPDERTSRVLSLILDGAETLGLITEIKGKKYVDLSASLPSYDSVEEDSKEELSEAREIGRATAAKATETPPATVDNPSDSNKKKRVFITHGKDKSFVDPIKKLLSFGELEPVVSVERQTVSQPVPDKVMNDMRSCGAAIIHVDAEMELIDKDANKHLVMNPNVLIEIGAAMALYGRRFILLVKSGVNLPSNLQGLYEVRYTGDSLDGDATIKLLEAIREMKTHASPITN